MRKLRCAAIIATVFCLTSCTATPPSGTATHQSSEAKTPTAWQITATYPHDTSLFTQGIELLDSDTVIESAGLYGNSNLQIHDLKHNTVKRKTELTKEYFGEGVTRVKDHFVSLTWQNHKAYTWSKNLEKTGEINYPEDGWGICFNEHTNTLWTSDGSSQLISRNPDTLQEIGRVTVNFNGKPQNNLNELECAGDKVWANIWFENTIIEIDPNTGTTTAYLDLSQLVKQAKDDYRTATGNSIQDGEVLNGIAWDASSDSMLVTGKHWAKIYRLKLNR